MISSCNALFFQSRLKQMAFSDCFCTMLAHAQIDSFMKSDFSFIIISQGGNCASFYNTWNLFPPHSLPSMLVYLSKRFLSCLVRQLWNGLQPKLPIIPFSSPARVYLSLLLASLLGSRKLLLHLLTRIARFIPGINRVLRLRFDICY